MKLRITKTLAILAASYECSPFKLAARRGLSELEAMYELEAAVRQGLAEKTADGYYSPTLTLRYCAGKLKGVPQEDFPTTF